MARSRRGAGPRGTLGTLLRTTLAQAGVVREVLERGAREGRARLDDVRRERRRDQALARLAEAVLTAVRAGDADELYDLPEVADALAELDGLDAGAEEPSRDPFADPDADHDADRDAAAGRRRAPPWVPPAIRERFDRFDRRPPRPPPVEAAGGDVDEDGTVSSASWRPPAPTRPAPAPRRPTPPAADRPAAGGRRAADEPGARFQERAPARRGGIQFAAADDDPDDDEGLAAFMHPDDVPARPAPGAGAGAGGGGADDDDGADGADGAV